MNFRWVIGLIAVLAFPPLCKSAPLGPHAKCFSCDVSKPVAWLHPVTALNHGALRKVCGQCLQSAPECVVCRVPAEKRFKVHEDGRHFCEEDYETGIFERREAEHIAYETTRELTRVFWRFGMKFPETNVTISISDVRTLCKRAGIRYNPLTPIVGLTVTEVFDSTGKKLTPEEWAEGSTNGPLRYQHEIHLVSGFSKTKMVSTCAHELGHAWLHENIPQKRLKEIDKESVEGFCELIAYQLMDAHYEDFEKRMIRENLYTRGQQNVLIETDSWYGFYKILKWFDDGTSDRLTDPDLIRRVSEGAAPTRASTGQPFSWPSAAPVTLAETILLKGITGTANRRMALVNNVNLMQGEESRIRLAHTNVIVQCVQIRDSSVVLKIDGAEEQEFFLKTP